MRLGKALATGVAEESVRSSEEEIEDRLEAETEELEPQAEVPAVR
ncbi:hypothetical protein [Streptomyces cavernae]|nr:hypothetical protein [Streptomyces cavernae]